MYNNVQKTTKFVLFPSITVNDIRLHVHDRNWLTSIYKERIKDTKLPQPKRIKLALIHTILLKNS